MQKLNLSQTLTQKLSPQQIQFIKLLQVPTAELDTRIEEELESNPALEEGPDDSYEEPATAADEDDFGSDTDEERYGEDLDVSEYLRDDDYAGYKMQGDGPSDEEERDMPLAAGSTLTEQLMSNLGFLGLDERQEAIAKQLVGSIEPDGYIRRELDAIANDLAFSQNIRTDEEELERILHLIQEFDPPGIAARDLRECLLLQLRRKEPTEAVMLATRLIDDHFEEFTKKHYKKILKRLGLESEEELKSAIDVITRLNPKPGGAAAGSNVRSQYLIPDFIITNNNGKLELTLNGRNAPDLRISRSYADMLDAYDKSNKKDKKLKETVSFVKQKLDSARWFIDAIRQRQHTLLNVMGAIMDYQYEYFLEGDETKLRPMILKDIADRVGMDISTISRVASSKSVQTEFGVLPLKYFFSEGISTESGEDVSSREVKQVLKDMIDGENKKKPLSDDKLEKMLNEKGYQIARRTVAKYREQLGIPVARLRKEL
ncbi:RNA polymerase, sigma 54 subunit, RpoN [Flammeovirgaceae bacterium 311]|nr:RNA polymerase, sigma 54 subunit, RpoN [Flammeovirgaceae bacterium 311]